MTRRRWIADEFSAHGAALTGAHAAHLARTLRARAGQEFEIICGNVVRHATISSVADDRVEFALGGEARSTAAVPITLLLAVFKFDRMEWAIEKCTELNVTTIVPVIARRTEKHLAQAAEKRVERWRRIARQASEQSRRTAPPEISTPLKHNEVLQIEKQMKGSSTVVMDQKREVQHNEPGSSGTEVSPGPKSWPGSLSDGLSSVGAAQNRAAIENHSGALKLVLDENERDLMLTEVLRAQSDVRSLTLAIGPEGGWTPEELQDFVVAQFLSCSLGDTILRAETAAIAALAVARSEI
jgi:16S rRNA (uracil1498-N3)-methyltransferase